jgi:polyhydroxyalkanoate synthesis repressor PhaR
VIKRYPNRKLYDTEAKQYITLEGIAALIREGKEVQVVDHATGEDLTSLTLTQVILELERRRTGFLPQGVLAGLIQAGGETLGSLRRSLASPLDLARHVDEEIERRMQELVHGGELAATEAIRLRDKLFAWGRPTSPVPPPSDDEIEQSLATLGVPTKEQFRQLVEQLDRLEAKLDGLGSAEEKAAGQ